MTGPITIEARDVWKSFDKGRGDLLSTRDRWRMVGSERPRTSVLEDISFDVRAGEVMGCVGPNGAGKSTLLKLIAGIYNFERGSIRVAGRVAPLIELGVGFRPDLPARENILLNGVMMGLTPAEARHRTDEILDFAELREHVNLKLKNYSSGMRGRLGFSVMIHVDADILLIDEILSVGDKAFREKCGDVISQLRRDGQTVVLVSHEMGSITRHCDRAMLLQDHRIEILDDSETVANRYHELHAIRQIEAAGGAVDEGHRSPATITDLAFADRDRALEPGQPLAVEAEIEVGQPLTDPGVRLIVHDMSGRPLYMTSMTSLTGGWPAEIGSSYRLRGTIENRLAPGAYRLSCRVAEQLDEADREPLRSPAKWLQFVVAGESDGISLVGLHSEVEVQPIEPGKVLL